MQIKAEWKSGVKQCGENINQDDQILLMICCPHCTFVWQCRASNAAETTHTK